MALQAIQGGTELICSNAVLPLQLRRASDLGVSLDIGAIIIVASTTSRQPTSIVTTNHKHRTSTVTIAHTAGATSLVQTHASFISIASHPRAPTRRGGMCRARLRRVHSLQSMVSAVNRRMRQLVALQSQLWGPQQLRADHRHQQKLPQHLLQNWP
mgnify:CR=1 FL=1